MIHENRQHSPQTFLPPIDAVARLVINGTDVGSIHVQRTDSSWVFGRFTPAPSFSTYAPIFGVWSLLMHDDEDAPLHETASKALNAAERQMDALHIEARFINHGVTIKIGQLNIDGDLVEWKMW